ncbi:hypothetical protein [Vibrio phage BONAISHI]|nr:hypothetical protein [Vibrio phage BONAISHI]
MSIYQNRTATMTWEELKTKGRLPEEVREEIFAINNPELAGLDPYMVEDPAMQEKVIIEAITNPWYTLSHLVRVPIISGSSIRLRWSEEIVTFFLAGMDADLVYLEGPRQAGGTTLMLARIVTELIQGLHTNVDIKGISREHDIVGIRKLSEFIDALPDYVIDYLDLDVITTEGNMYKYPRSPEAKYELFKSAAAICGTASRYYFRLRGMNDRVEIPEDMDRWYDQMYYHSGETNHVHESKGEPKLIIVERFCSYTHSEITRDRERIAKWSLLPELITPTAATLRSMEGKAIYIQLSMLNDLRTEMRFLRD